MAEINFFNKKEFEWADFQLRLSGADLTPKLRGLSVRIDADKEALFAGGKKAISIQTGNESYSGSLKVLFGALMDIWVAAVAAGATNPTDIEVDIIGTVVKKGTREVYNVIISGAEFPSIDFDLNQGDKFVEVTLAYLALDMKLVKGN